MPDRHACRANGRVLRGGPVPCQGRFRTVSGPLLGRFWAASAAQGGHVAVAELGELE
ncbi:hypothetical protein GCM10023334_062790 [Nonomuraea thailandensis]